jgi:hypothetical protein
LQHPLHITTSSQVFKILQQHEQHQSKYVLSSSTTHSSISFSNSRFVPC